MVPDEKDIVLGIFFGVFFGESFGELCERRTLLRFPRVIRRPEPRRHRRFAWVLAPSDLLTKTNNEAALAQLRIRLIAWLADDIGPGAKLVLRTCRQRQGFTPSTGVGGNLHPRVGHRAELPALRTSSAPDCASSPRPRRSHTDWAPRRRASNGQDRWPMSGKSSLGRLRDPAFWKVDFDPGFSPACPRPAQAAHRVRS